MFSPNFALSRARSRAFALGLTLGALLVGSAPKSEAQALSSPSDAPAAVPAKAIPAVEVVRLVSGAEYKGQIAERVPDSHVVIVTMVGETKRFAWSEVAYAGYVEPRIVAEMAPDTTPLVTPVTPVAAPGMPVDLGPAPGLVRLGLQSSPPGITWHAEDSARRRRTLCMAPCTADLTPGLYRLGLSASGRPTVWLPASKRVEGNASWRGDYHSKRGSRIAGAVILGVGVPVGLITLFAGVRANSDADRVCSSGGAASGACSGTAASPGTPAVIGGAIVAIASAVVGLALVSREDDASIQTTRSGRGNPFAEAQPESQPISVEQPEFAGTLWTCVNDEDVRSVRLRIEVDAAGVIERVVDVEEVSWGARNCIKNNLLGSHAGGGVGPRTMLITR